jgi:hypothetical protein
VVTGAGYTVDTSPSSLNRDAKEGACLRVDYANSFPKELETVLALEAAVRHAGLEPPEEIAALAFRSSRSTAGTDARSVCTGRSAIYVSPCHPATGA